MTSALRYASEGGQIPPYLKMYDITKEYGTRDVMGRTLFAFEIYRMNAARNVYEAYMERKASDNWAEWADKHPNHSKILNYVERLTNDD